jgi:hypothetical protein
MKIKIKPQRTAGHPGPLRAVEEEQTGKSTLFLQLFRAGAHRCQVRNVAWGGPEEWGLKPDTGCAFFLHLCSSSLVVETLFFFIILEGYVD